jgi:carbon-monoxide dehydrogenase large subunit
MPAVLSGTDGAATGGAYAAVYLRMHPTGKGVLSLSESSSGQEARYAQLVADELGIPVEDIKVEHEDTDRFGTGHGFSTSPSQNTTQAVVATARKVRDKASQIAAAMLGSSGVSFDNGYFFTGRDRSNSVKFPDVCLKAHAGGELPPGMDGHLNMQTVYRA